MSGTIHLLARYLQQTMSIPVLLFASYADAFGARRIDVPLAAPCSVGKLVEAMRALPGGARLPNAPLIAVNRAWVREDHTIATGDEVALIPPVAGG
jgi:molybdopterin converting factor small subunit